jgi:hypothetical protein
LAVDLAVNLAVGLESDLRLAHGDFADWDFADREFAS